MKEPEHLKGNTSLIWMHHRTSGNEDWCLEGLVYVATDETGRFQDIQITQAFEIHDQGNQVIIPHHPKFTVDQLQGKVKEVIMARYKELNEKY